MTNGATTAGTMAELLRRTGANALKDRSAIGIMAETMGRMAARDQAITCRLIRLGVQGDDEEAIFDRLAEWIAKLDVLARGSGLTAHSTIDDFNRVTAFRDRQVRHARELLEVFAEVCQAAGDGQPLPSEPGELRTALAALVDSARASRVAELEQRLRDERAITVGLQRELERAKAKLAKKSPRKGGRR